MPAHFISPDTPVPVPPNLIRVKNGWLASNGRTLVAAYAGEAGNDPSVGRFVIIRQNLVFGIQTRDIVDAGQTGAVHITSAPTGRSVETSAQHADLSFSSASSSGVLHLSTDTITPA
jgi:hypothetical protein